MSKISIDLVGKALSYLVLTLIVALNYTVLTNESYIGDFVRTASIRVYPPFRLETRIATYDIESGEVDLIVIRGLTFTTTVIDADADLVRVKSIGPDLFIIASSIFVAVAYIVLSKRKPRGVGGLLAVTLPLVIVINSYLYVQVSLTPMSRAVVAERNEPLFCRDENNYTFCAVDSISYRSRIMVSVDREAVLVVLHRSGAEEASINGTLVKDIHLESDNATIWVLSIGKPRITYRRVSFIDNEARPEGLIEALVASTAALKAVTVALIKRFS